jgi:hypothetical protein
VDRSRRELLNDWAHYRSSVMAYRRWLRWWSARMFRARHAELVRAERAKLRQQLATLRRIERRLGFRPRFRAWLGGEYHGRVN